MVGASQWCANTDNPRLLDNRRSTISSLGHAGVAASAHLRRGSSFGLSFAFRILGCRRVPSDYALSLGQYAVRQEGTGSAAVWRSLAGVPIGTTRLPPSR